MFHGGSSRGKLEDYLIGPRKSAAGFTIKQRSLCAIKNCVDPRGPRSATTVNNFLNFLVRLQKGLSHDFTNSLRTL